MKIALCVPSGDEVKADFWLSWSSMLMFEAVRVATGEIEIVHLNIRTSLIQNSRFHVVKDALARGCEKILFIDSDIVFPEDAMRRLLAHDKAIVGATYVRRREPHRILGAGIGDIPPGAAGLWPMARLPTGMLLIDAAVFGQIPKPWFPVTFETEIEEFTSEDHGFCDLARSASLEIWCDLDLSHELGHIGQQAFTWAQAERAP